MVGRSLGREVVWGEEKGVEGFGGRVDSRGRLGYSDRDYADGDTVLPFCD